MVNVQPTKKQVWSPALQGLGVSLAMLVAVGLFELANGDAAGFLPLLFEDSRPRTTSILILLTGFIWSAFRHSHDAFQRDVADLIPHLTCTDEERDEIIGPEPFKGGRGAHAASIAGAVVGVLIIQRRSGTPLIFDDTPFDHHLVAGLAINIILFALMGRGTFWSLKFNRIIASLGPVMPPVDLFDLRSFKPFARHGLRGAVLWLGGSSIASLLFIDQQHGALTALIIAATVGLGTYSLFWPLRGVHEIISRAKEEELARVHDVLRGLREDLLANDPEDSAKASQRISGLIAYEARIAAVRDWPMDVPTIVRFALLLSVAVGSWLGGAVVEMLLGSVIDQ